MPRALVIRGGAIGDFILTLPAIALLRRSLPELEIEVLGYKPVVDLALGTGVADRVRSFEHGLYAPLFTPGADIRPDLEQWLAEFQRIVSYLHDPDCIFATNLKRFTKATLLPGPARIDESAARHAAEQLAAPLEKLAMWLDHEAPPLAICPADTDAAPGGAIALHPGSGGLHKCWPLEQWLELAHELADQGSCIIWITGEAEIERGITARLRQASRPHTFELWENLPLIELSERLTRFCRAFIGHDSGITHLANACGLHGLAIFGPTDPAIWRPWNGRIEVLEAPEGDLARLATADVLTRVGELACRAGLEKEQPH